MQKLIICFLIFSVFTNSSLAISYIEELRNTPNDSATKVIELKNKLINDIYDEEDYEIAFSRFTEAGLLFYSKNRLDFAEEFFVMAKNIANENSDIANYAQMLSNIGVIKELSGDYISALNNYHKALQTFKISGDKRSESLVYNNIAIVHQELGNKNLAHKNLINSYKLKVEINDSLLIASTLNNFGVFYEEAYNNLDSAIYYYTKASELYRLLDDEINYAICLNNIGQVYIKLNEFDTALDFFNQALSIFKKNDNNKWESIVLKHLGIIELHSSNYLEAILLLERSYQLIYPLGFTPYLLEVIQPLADAYYNTGQFQKSSEKFQKYVYLSDSISDIEMQKEINRLEIRFQTAQKEFEIESLKHEKELREQEQRKLISYVIALIIIMGLIIIVLISKVRQRKLMLQNKNISIKQELLQKQMNPHFLFNVLTSIQLYIKNSDVEKASVYISKFSGLIRSVLNSSVRENISLKEEVELLSNYIELEKLRFNNSFSSLVNLKNVEDLEDIYIPPMMIQPFVENAIHHGLTNISNGILEITIKEIENNNKSFIIFTIYDNGKGFLKSENNRKHESMSLKILSERKKVLRIKHKRDVEIKYLPEKIGTIVEITLPII